MAIVLGFLGPFLLYVGNIQEILNDHHFGFTDHSLLLLITNLNILVQINVD